MCAFTLASIRTCTVEYLYTRKGRNYGHELVELDFVAEVYVSFCRSNGVLRVYSRKNEAVKKHKSEWSAHVIDIFVKTYEHMPDYLSNANTGHISSGRNANPFSKHRSIVLTKMDFAKLHFAP